MSYENRKREYDRLVTSGQVPPEVLVKEFGKLKPEDVNIEPKLRPPSVEKVNNFGKEPKKKGKK